MEAIVLKGVYKSFRIYGDRAVTIKERALHRKRKSHEVHQVLNGIDMTIHQGDVVGLIGENGCGKSTTLKLMTRIMYPEKGEINVNGRVSSLLELGAGFHPDVSGRENVYTNAAIFGLSKKETDARIEEIIRFSELEEYIDNPVRTYSSGMYMRLAFSVAINVDADILLIDEILAVGDTNFQQKCYRKLNELKDNGITIVLVTHESGTVEKFCNRAIWLSHGEIMADGTPQSVVAQYRSYMSEKQVEAMRRQEHAIHDERIKERPDWKGIDFTADHFGTDDAIVTSACLIDSAGKPTKVLRTGEPVTIQIQYKVVNPQRGYVFGTGFFTTEGKTVWGNNTAIDGMTIKQLPFEGTVECSIPSLPLLGGEYKLNISIEDDNGTPLDFYRDYLRFTVIPNDTCTGMVLVERSWSVPQQAQE